MRQLLSGRTRDLVRLYDEALEEGGLVPTDFYTVHDLLDLSGCLDQEPLHALLLAMLLALDEGSLCVEASEDGLTRRLHDLVGQEEARSWARRILEALAETACTALIGATAADGKPVLLYQGGQRRYLYFQKYFKQEESLAASLRARLAAGPSQALPGDLAEVLREVLVARPVYLRGQPVKLNQDQRVALAMSLLRRFLIISGGPGTGKTSVVFTLLRCLVRCGVSPQRIALAAPTGRAAQRLTDALRAGIHGLCDGSADDASLEVLAANTLHRLLGYRPTLGTFRHHAENPLAADVVIVDEVSMVSLGLMAALLQAMTPETRLVLLGDKDQLPSVEAGALLAHLVPAADRSCIGEELWGQLRVLLPDLRHAPAAPPEPLQNVLVVLTENYRSGEELKAVARAVNRQDAMLVDKLPRLAPADAPRWLAELEHQRGCRLLDLAADGLAGWRRVLAAWAEHHFQSVKHAGATYQELVSQCRGLADGDLPPETREVLDNLFALLARARILTLLREGPWGNTGVNRLLEHQLRPRLDGSEFGGLFAGAPVLITRNDPGRELFNGDVGIVLRSATDGYRAVFPRASAYVSLPVDALPAHELAFALTVHKSQGSEYGQVLLTLPPEGGRRLLTKELIYTGVTRARETAIIAGTVPALQVALARRIERESALLARLNQG
jgi:exodeoxyribonuclease V alpha subunit